MNEDRLYYARRAKEQRIHAERADHPGTRLLHQELADLLAARAESL